MSTVLQPKAPPKNKNRMGAVVAFLLLTLAAASAGGIFGLRIQAAFVQPAEVNELASSELPKLKDDVFENGSVLSIPPVVTNLAEPKNAWVRIEASAVLAGDRQASDDVLATKLGEDLVAYLTTTTASQIEGAAGLQHLREDLNERARLRSDGRVRELIIHTFIIE